MIYQQQLDIVEINKISKEIEYLYEQLQPEEAARFRRQIITKYKKLAAAERLHLYLQSVPINKPDALPRKIWQKKKNYSKADIKAFTGAEIAKRTHYERKITYRKTIATKDISIIPPGSLRLPRES